MKNQKVNDLFFYALSDIRVNIQRIVDPGEKCKRIDIINVRKLTKNNKRKYKRLKWLFNEGVFHGIF